WRWSPPRLVRTGSTRIAWIGRTSESPLRLGIRRARGVRGGDPRLIHRLPRPDGRRWPALRQPGRVHPRGPREGLRVDMLPDLRHLAISNGDVEDPIVLERLIRGFDFSRRDADDQNPVSLRHEF